MYDINERKKFGTVGELKSIIKDIPDDTKIVICGDDYCYFHIEKDRSVVNLDNEDLDDEEYCYEQNAD